MVCLWVMKTALLDYCFLQRTVSVTKHLCENVTAFFYMVIVQTKVSGNFLFLFLLLFFTHTHFYFSKFKHDGSDRATKKNASLCPKFIGGKCHVGRACRLLHDGLTLDFWKKWIISASAAELSRIREAALYQSKPPQNNFENHKIK